MQKDCRTPVDLLEEVLRLNGEIANMTQTTFMRSMVNDEFQSLAQCATEMEDKAKELAQTARHLRNTVQKRRDTNHG